MPFFEHGSCGLGSEHTANVWTAIFSQSWQMGVSKCLGRSEHKQIGNWNTNTCTESEAGSCSMTAETGCMCEGWHQATHYLTEQVEPHTQHKACVFTNLLVVLCLFCISANWTELASFHIKDNKTVPWSSPQCSQIKYKASSHAWLLQKSDASACSGLFVPYFGSYLGYVVG